MQDFLDKVAKRYKVTEGHITEQQIEFLRDILQKHANVKNILEIGFNGGHSSVTMLSSSEDVCVTSFDIGQHDYVLPAKALVDELFPGRHKLVLGDSVETLAKCQEPFDFAFVDGGHFGHVPESDIRNAIRLLSKGDLIVVDDTNYPDVVDAYQTIVKEGLATIYDGPTAFPHDRAWVVLQKV